VKRTILLVDDDRAILELVANALVRDNFSVTTATSAEEALPVLDRDEFTLVITDFRMPGKSGDAVVNAVRKNRPETEVMIITGLPHEMPEWLRSGPQAVRILAKPFSISDLRDAVTETIAGGHASCLWPTTTNPWGKRPSITPVSPPQARPVLAGRDNMNS
jgi:DNA-binding NtrC family response regulator